MGARRKDRVKLPGEPQSVIVRGVDDDAGDVAIFYERDDGTTGEIVLSTADFGSLQPIRLTGEGDANVGLAGLWGYWITGAIAGIRQTALATTPLRAYAHQDDAVYGAMLPQPTLRFLLADEPGTGKTIMCGMYIVEMMRQNRLRRVLIAVPAHLLAKWERDLLRFFGLRAERITAETARSAAPLRPDIDVWLVSVDLLARNPQVQGKAVFAPEAAWDLVVIDEGHRLTPTAQVAFPVALELAKRCTHLLIMTATPHRGSEYLFRALMHLLDPDVYPWSREDQALLESGASRLRPARMHFLRRMKEQLRDHDNITPLFPPRRAHNEAIPLSATEQQLYEDVLAYCDAYMDDNSGLARSVYGKRAASSLFAISETLRRRVERISASGVENAYRLTAPLSADDLVAEDDEEQGELEERANAVRSKDAGIEHAANSELRARIAALLDDKTFVSAKWLILARDILPQHGITPTGQEQLLVFTEYADTAWWLESVFTKYGYTARRYAGDVPREERERIQVDFLDGRFQVLISTDAGNEGIDLQSAHVLVNWDIPWSIVRLEQRAGRLHRIGQHSRVDIYNLISNTTREGRVQDVVLGNIVNAANALDGKLFDFLGSVAEQLGVDYGRLMLQASRGGAATDAAVRQARSVTSTQYEQAGRQQQDIERPLVTTTDNNAFLDHVMNDRLDAINPAVVAAFMAILAGARGWTMNEWLHAHLYQLRAARGSTLPTSLGGKNGALIAASVDSLTQARRDGADLSQAIVLGPAEPAYRTLVESVVGEAADALAMGVVLVDQSALTHYELFVFETGIVKRQAGRSNTTAHPTLVRVDGSGARVVAWQSVSHLAVGGQSPDGAPRFGSGSQVDAESVASIEIQRVAEGERANLLEWVRRVSEQLDRLQDEVVEPYRGLSREEQRVRYEAVRRAVAARKHTIAESAEVAVQPLRLVGRVYVRAAASMPTLAGDPDLDFAERERITTDSEMIAMRLVKEQLEAEGFDVDDVHQSGVGYDLHARRGYEQRCVEVKGLIGDITPGITLESSEWLMAQQYRDDYWVYVVTECAITPRLFGVYRNPVAIFGDDKKLIQRFHVAGSTLRKVLTA